jgi:hypothetical protein
MRVPSQTGSTDENGMVSFENLPVGLYLIDVSFSQDFCSAQKRYQLVLENSSKRDYKVFIGL